MDDLKVIIEHRISILKMLKANIESKGEEGEVGFYAGVSFGLEEELSFLLGLKVSIKS